MAKIGRNVSCPCGSGLKYKRCHGRLSPVPPVETVEHLLASHQARERIRQTQQGLGRPIVSGRMRDHQLVVVGKTLYWSPNWRTFPDFLMDYIKRKLGSEWGKSEIAKPWAERHPLLQWYDTCCRYQQSTIQKPGEPASAIITGAVAGFLGRAHALYLLDHNVELQTRLINRLKDPGNFRVLTTS